MSVAVAYNVGSRNERQGRTGFAHLFEHLMFKGSENVADGELAGLIENYGGNHNGQTDKDHTIYFEQVPSNQLDMVLFLEADRMRSPAITKENIDNQREAVKEERRLRVDNQPYGRTSETIAELAFENFANEHSIIGSMADLDAASLEDFQPRSSRPTTRRTTRCWPLPGDVDEKTHAREGAQVLRGHSLRARLLRRSTQPSLPQKEERRSDRAGSARAADAGRHRVSGAGRAESRHGRAERAGVGAGRGPQLAACMTASCGSSRSPCRCTPGVQQSKGPGLFYLEAMAAPGKDPADVEKAIYAEVEKIQKGPIQEWELEKARNAARRSLVGNLRSSLQRAILLVALRRVLQRSRRSSTRGTSASRR